MVRIAEGNGWIRNGDFIDLGPEGVRQEMYNKGRLGIVSNYLTLRVDEFGNKYDSCVQTRRGIINDTRTDNYHNACRRYTCVNSCRHCARTMRLVDTTRQSIRV